MGLFFWNSLQMQPHTLEMFRPPKKSKLCFNSITWNRAQQRKQAIAVYTILITATMNDKENHFLGWAWGGAGMQGAWKVGMSWTCIQRVGMNLCFELVFLWLAELDVGKWPQLKVINSLVSVCTFFLVRSKWNIIKTAPSPIVISARVLGGTHGSHRAGCNGLWSLYMWSAPEDCRLTELWRGRNVWGSPFTNMGSRL